jgi:cytosine/adenosine deaminase-related metal-dependent hydrolase
MTACFKLGRENLREGKLHNLFSCTLEGLSAMAVATLFACVGNAQTPPHCSVITGDRSLLIQTTVLLPDGPAENDQVVVAENGQIACVGPNCRRVWPHATRLVCEGMVLSPGLINTHDHIDFSHVAPRPDTGERFEHRHEWRKGLDGHLSKENFEADHDRRVIAWGELRFLVGGTTSTVGGDMAPGLLRNLDFASGLEGLPAHPVTYKVFPLDDADGIMRTHDCDYGHNPATHESVAQTNAFLAHVAEGGDEAARNEFLCESSTVYDSKPQSGGGGTSNDWLMPQATLIHAVALTHSDLSLVAQRGASIVWSPRSNLSLYGRTLDVLEAHRLEITIALGSDWLPSGSMNLNRELACAAHYSQEHMQNALSDHDLWRMVTVDAARAVHDDALIGSIQVGKLADLALFEGKGEKAVTESTPQKVALVLRGGTVLYGRDELVDRLKTGCQPLNVGGDSRRLCSESGTPNAVELEEFAHSRGLYPLAFSGKPTNEPSCETSP